MPIKNVRKAFVISLNRFSSDYDTIDDLTDKTCYLIEVIDFYGENEDYQYIDLLLEEILKIERNPKMLALVSTLTRRYDSHLTKRKHFRSELFNLIPDTVSVPLAELSAL